MNHDVPMYYMRHYLRVLNAGTNRSLAIRELNTKYNNIIYDKSQSMDLSRIRIARCQIDRFDFIMEHRPPLVFLDLGYDEISRAHLDLIVCISTLRDVFFMMSSGELPAIQANIHLRVSQSMPHGTTCVMPNTSTTYNSLNSVVDVTCLAGYGAIYDMGACSRLRSVCYSECAARTIYPAHSICITSNGSNVNMPVIAWTLHVSDISKMSYHAVYLTLTALILKYKPGDTNTYRDGQIVINLLNCPMLVSADFECDGVYTPGSIVMYQRKLYTLEDMVNGDITNGGGAGDGEPLRKFTRLVIKDATGTTRLIG